MKIKYDQKMLPISLLIPLAIFILIDSYWVLGAVTLWFKTPNWGWSLPLKLQAASLMVSVLITGSVTFFLIRKLTQRKNIAILMLVVLSIAAAWGGVLIVTYSPNLIPAKQRLEQLNISPESLSRMSACDKVEQFAEAGYQYLDLIGISVFLPGWVLQSLDDIPKDIVLDCIKMEIMQQLDYIHGDSLEREIATKKIYVLLFESMRLGLLNSPTILEIENVVVCQKKIDVVGRISFLYYIGQNHYIPDYDYFSLEGKTRLFSDVCK